MGPESRSSAKTEARRRFWKLPVRIAKPLSLRAGDQIVLVVVRGDRGSQCCSYDYQKKAAGLWPASIDERQGKLLRQCVRRDLLQIPAGVTKRKCRNLTLTTNKYGTKPTETTKRT